MNKSIVRRLFVVPKLQQQKYFSQLASFISFISPAQTIWQPVNKSNHIKISDDLETDTTHHL
jgi:hypothetical protein